MNIFDNLDKKIKLIFIFVFLAFCISMIALYYYLFMEDLKLQVYQTLSIGFFIVNFLMIGFCIDYLFTIQKLRQKEKSLQEKNKELILLKNQLEEKVYYRTAELENQNRLLVEAKEKAEESDSLKSAFIANMSHEIRTPLSGVIGLSELIIKPNLSEERKKEFIKIIKQSGDDLLKIINDILDISKIETGQVKLVEDECYLDIFFKDLETIFLKKQEHWEKNHIQLKFNYEIDSLKSCILVDIVRLKQILQHIFDNALKFTDQGFIHINCKLLENQFILFSIQDTGIGILSDKKDFVFERFRQIDESLTRKYGGNGLGLSLAKALVELFKGEIWLESEKGVGSTFYFTIPYKPTSISLFQDSIQNPKHNWEQLKVLLVEDDLANASFLVEILKECKLNVIDVKNGKEALDIFQKELDFSLVLMDIQLPDTNGYKLIKEFKKISTQIPVIAQTAFAMPEDKDKCLRAGFDDYISKPLDIPLLMEKLEKYLV